MSRPATGFALSATWLLALFAPCAEAQGPSRIPYRGAPETVSIGQPSRAHVQWGPALGYDFERERVSGRLNLGINAELLLPQIGFLDLTTEGAVGFIGSEPDVALGTSLKFPYFNPGLEYNFPDETLYLKLTAIGAPRRGGLLGVGDRIRLDWIPGKGLVQLGLAIEQPFARYHRNRPMNRHLYMERVELPEPAVADTSLFSSRLAADLRSSIAWMDLLSTPLLGLCDPSSEKSLAKFDERAHPLATHVRQTGRSFAGEDSLYHDILRRAFAQTAGGQRAAGDTLARAAERILLEQVLIPTNRLFGRLKKPIDISIFLREASFQFGIAAGRAGLAPSQSAAAAEVFRGALVELKEVAKRQKERWEDSRLVWLPLQYGLVPEQYDTQDELNRLFEALVEREFTTSNEIGYLFADDFYYFYKTLLLETQYYQVTVIHDFRHKTGRYFDQAAWSIVADGYIEAFIRAIQAMDRGERDILPEFFLFLDEHYYRTNKSRPIVDLLENLSRRGPVTLADPTLQERVRRQQQRLRDVIEASSALKRFGKDYVKNAVRIQVNITHQFDPTFKEDAVARDHRKLAFRDIFEDDPALGVAVFTGEGIGEYYLGRSWEDRSLALRGPDLVKLKTEVRELFLSQGFREDEVPYYLRERPFPDDYDRRCQALHARGWTASALTTMNEPGFREKTASVARMALYNLMPKGSLLLVPDSIWASDFWASYFVALGLRGVQVYAVAPSKDHAPSDAIPTLEIIRESLAGMLRGAEILREEMKAAGGSLQVGIFSSDFDVCSPSQRVDVFLRSDADSVLLAGGLRLHPAIRQAFVRERETLLGMTDTLLHVVDRGGDRKTKLHQKTQFFSTREGVGILDRPEWSSFLDSYLEHHRHRCRQPDRVAAGVQPVWLRAGEGTMEAGSAVVDGFEAALAAEAPEDLRRVAYFLMIGSQNQDRRGMLLDGEVTVTVAGYESLVALMDFVFVLKASHWLDSSQAVDAYYPKASNLIKTISHWIHNLI